MEAESLPEEQNDELFFYFNFISLAVVQNHIQSCRQMSKNCIFDQSERLGSVPDNKSQTSIKVLILHTPGCHPTSQIFCPLGQKWLASRSNPTAGRIPATRFSGSPVVTLVNLHLGLEVVANTKKIPLRTASCCLGFTALA